jgi:hypothetical protein
VSARHLGLLPARLGARWRWILAATAGVFAAYHVVILVILGAGLGGPPTYLRLYPAIENARRIVRLTPSLGDVVVLIAREPLLEYGRLHPTFGAAVWSFELTWSGLLFFGSFSALLGAYLGLGAVPRGWSAFGSLGGAGTVGLLGASVSSLTHCGLGSFGVLLALAGVSTVTIGWFAQLEPVLIPAGYLMLLAALARRAAALARRAAMPAREGTPAPSAVR